jgi:hypothetical protein
VPRGRAPGLEGEVGFPRYSLAVGPFGRYPSQRGARRRWGHGLWSVGLGLILLSVGVSPCSLAADSIVRLRSGGVDLGDDEGVVDGERAAPRLLGHPKHDLHGHVGVAALEPCPAVPGPGLPARPTIGPQRPHQGVDPSQSGLAAGRFGFHALGHTYAGRCVAARIPPLQLSRFLGRQSDDDAGDLYVFWTAPHGRAGSSRWASRPSTKNRLLTVGHLGDGLGYPSGAAWPPRRTSR